MEELKFGLIKGIEVKFVKTDSAIIEAISKKINEPIEKVKIMLRYNVFNINQFMDLSQLADSTIRNKIRPSIIAGELNTELDYCYPFPSSKNDGPLFILRNEKSEKYLKA
jgi:hypothetical protein